MFNGVVRLSGFEFVTYHKMRSFKAVLVLASSDRIWVNQQADELPSFSRWEGCERCAGDRSEAG
ncbi:hypothetical protein [Leptolyngbya sp. DQ-M1]|uniref:hypothetical protein n=1 Tax=Leptolyngbya sp. DQ-M1 TaxID=2933920 RepID=UPI003297B756